MSKLKIRSGGTWVDPTDISVRASNAWVGADKVYYRTGGNWVEIWPGATVFPADFAIITISVDSARYPDLIWEVGSQQPDFMTEPDQIGGRVIQSGPNAYRKHVTPRPVFYPEPYANSFNTRLGRAEQNTFQFETLYDGQITNDLLIERMGVVQDNASLAAMAAGYRQVYIDYTNLRAEFVNSGSYWDWNDPQSLGDLFKFVFFASWPSGWAYNPASYPITFTIDLYEGGTLVRDPVTKIYSATGFTSTTQLTQTYTAKKRTADLYSSGIPDLAPYDYAAFALDFDYTAETVGISTYSPPSAVTIPRILEFRYNWSDANYLYPVCHIVTPDVNPSVGNPGTPMDIPYYNTSGTLTSYAQYPFSGLNGGTEAPGSGPGMDTVAETVQYTGRYGSFNSGSRTQYPYRNFRITDRWWLDGYKEVLDQSDLSIGLFNYFIFDVWQYKWDNPDATTVTFQLGAWWAVGQVLGTLYQSPNPVTVNVFQWDDSVAAGFNKGANSVPPNFQQGNYIGSPGTFAKVVTDKNPDTSGSLGNTPRYGTIIGTVTVDYVNNTVTLAPA